MRCPYWLSREGLGLVLQILRLRAETRLWELRAWRIRFLMRWFDPWFYPWFYGKRHQVHLEAEHLRLSIAFVWSDLRIGWLRAQNLWLRARLRFLHWQLGIGEFDPTNCAHCGHTLAIHLPRCTVAGCHCRRWPPGSIRPGTMSRGRDA